MFYKKIHILYVEDTEADYLLLKMRLADNIFSIERVEDGEQALAIYHDHLYDLIIIDYRLPGMNGIDVANALITNKNCPPLIMLTSAGNESIAVEAIKMGVSDYLVKDIDGGYLDLLPSIAQRAIINSTMKQEKESMEKKQRNNQTYLKMILDIAQIGSWDYDLIHNIMKWSDEMYSILGMSDHECMPSITNFLNKVHPDDQVLVKSAIQQALQKHTEYQIEYRIVHPENQQCTIIEKTKVIFDPHTQEPKHILGILQDITDRKELELALLEAKKTPKNTHN